MSTHLVAWQQAIDSAVFTPINTVVDDVLTRTGLTRYLVAPNLNRVHWAMALGANITRAQLISPSLQVRRMNPEIVPRRRGAQTLSTTGPEIFKPYRPMLLTPGEELEADVAEDGAGATQVDVLACLGPDVLPAAPDGDIRIVRATGTTTLTALAWTSVVLTLDSSLEAGTYALVGFIPISTFCLAARAIITGQQNRPGMPGFAASESVGVDFDPARYDEIMYYNMGSFTHITIPAIQFFSSGADTTETVFLYLVKTG